MKNYRGFDEVKITGMSLLLKVRFIFFLFLETFNLNYNILSRFSEIRTSNNLIISI
jgi:hypothetical protein